MAELPDPQAGFREPRPPVSVVVPFRGGLGDASRMFDALSRIDRRPEDEILVADNSDRPALASEAPPGVVVLPASDHRSSYYARNLGAEAARNMWLLFIDADCEPAPDVIDRYFDEPIDSSCGALAGEVDAAGDGLLSRYADSRGLLRQSVNLSHPYQPSAVTANLLVRRQAWESIGGFLEGIRSGGDGDFCWRLQAAGWALAYRPGAQVLHRHRERAVPLARQVARHAAGAAWLNRRHRGSSPRPPLIRPLARSAAGVLVWGVTARFERASFKAIDALVASATWVGYRFGNVASREPEQFDVQVLVDSFPRVSETFIGEEVRAIGRQGVCAEICAINRPIRPLRGGARGVRTNYLEDVSQAQKLTACAWLVTRHPLRCIEDFRARRRWRAGADAPTSLSSVAWMARRASRSSVAHVHAHFAAGAALDAMRVARLLGLPYSVTAHAFEIFAEPRNLAEKLERSAFVTTGCTYNVNHLGAMFGTRRHAEIHEVVMGVDVTTFRRSSPRTEARAVAAVGRLVEKKGFEHLIEAAAILEAEGRGLSALTIVGEGPLRERLDELIDRNELNETVELAGALEPERVRQVLEDSAVLAMPCVVAANGDRDSMPVVVKEAMALELPVVGSDEVGLPEIVHPQWGQLVPPGDARALAGALDDVLSRPVVERQAMGREARAWVAVNANVDVEAAKLVSLMRTHGGLQPGQT